MKLFLGKKCNKRKEVKYEWTKGYNIPDSICQTNKKIFVAINPNNGCKMEFADYLSLPYLDQPYSDVVVFANISYQIYKILVTKWNHGSFPIDIFTSNEKLDLLRAIIELAKSTSLYIISLL